MASKKTLLQRLLHIAASRNAIPTRTNPTIARQSLIPTYNRSISPSSSVDPSVLIHRRSSTSAASTAAAARFGFPVGESLIEKLRGMDFTRDRIRLDGLIPPPGLPQPDLPEPEVAAEEGLTAADVASGVEKKCSLLRAVQMEALRAKVRGISNDWVSYQEFVQICAECFSHDKERAVVMARLLEESGSVIVIGNTVCLHPEQVVKAIQGLVPLPLSPNDPRMKELESMEKMKLEIDRRAESLVRRELWGGLVYLVAQTAAFMRLTFWELSWDVMEPICFYVTSFYFMAGYGFFLGTSKEPSFEGFFQSRFSTKQKRLMREQGFNLDRYNELRRACGLPIPGAASFSSAAAVCGRGVNHLGLGVGAGSNSQ